MPDDVMEFRVRFRMRMSQLKELHDFLKERQQTIREAKDTVHISDQVCLEVYQGFMETYARVPAKTEQETERQKST